MKAKIVKVNPSDLQSIMFEKSKWTVDKAKRWLKKHGFLRGDVDAGGERANYLRFRQFNPESGLRYRSIPLGKGRGIMASVAFTGQAPSDKHIKSRVFPIPANPVNPTIYPRGTAVHFDKAVRFSDVICTPEKAGLFFTMDGVEWQKDDERSASQFDTGKERSFKLGEKVLAHSFMLKGHTPRSRRNPTEYREETARRNPSDDAKWAIGFVDRDGRNDRAVVYGADSNDAYRNFVRSYGRHRVFSIKRMESHFYGNPRRGYEAGRGACQRCGDYIEPGMVGVCSQCKEEIEKEKELQRLGQGQKFRHRDYEQPIGDPQLAGTRYQR